MAINPIFPLPPLYEQKVLGGVSPSVSSAQRLPDTVDTFSAEGLLASTLLDLIEVDKSREARPALAQEQETLRNPIVVPWIVGGHWNLEVDNGDITEFQANFTMIKANGTQFHTHELSRFILNAVIPVVLDPQSGTTLREHLI